MTKLFRNFEAELGLLDRKPLFMNASHWVPGSLWHGRKLARFIVSSLTGGESRGSKSRLASANRGPSLSCCNVAGGVSNGDHVLSFKFVIWVLMFDQAFQVALVSTSVPSKRDKPAWQVLKCLVCSLG